MRKLLWLSAAEFARIVPLLPTGRRGAHRVDDRRVISGIIIPPNPTRKLPHGYDAEAYKQRNLIERMFCRLKDFRRIATRYDKRADIFLAAVMLAATITWWIN